jgi:hypothetical protein
MSLNHSPAIVTDGLVLCLDAGNSRSYPKSGTTWSDLVGSVSATLENSLNSTFSQDNLGNFDFDGADDYVDISNFDFFNYCNYNKPFSLCARCKFSGAGFQQIMGRQLTGGTYRGIALQLYNGNFRIGMFKDLSNRTFCDSSAISTNTYYDLVATFNGSNHSTGFSVYVNGQYDLQSVSAVGTIDQSVEASDGFVLGFRGQISGTKDARFGGIVYGVSIYNRALSADEVRRNYEATVGRYT